MFFFAPEENHQEQGDQQIAFQETGMQETATSDLEHKIEVLSEALQHSQGLLARRSFQANGQSLTLRHMKTIEKILHEKYGICHVTIQAEYHRGKDEELFNTPVDEKNVISNDFKQD